MTIVDEKYMKLALSLAKISGALGEVPVGTVVVVDDVVVGQGFNRRELLHSCIEHAEISALSRANANLGRWRLSDATVYSTLEPCIMCTGALLHARIKRLVFGASDPKFGAVVSLYQLASDPRLNHRIDVEAGVMAKECAEILVGFFQALRAKGDHPPAA